MVLTALNPRLSHWKISFGSSSRNFAASCPIQKNGRVKLQSKGLHSTSTTLHPRRPTMDSERKSLSRLNRLLSWDNRFTHWLLFRNWRRCRLNADATQFFAEVHFVSL